VTVFLTGVRDALETKDVLTRGTKVGGVGLDAATADRIVQALGQQLKELQEAGVLIRKETVKPPETSTFHLVKPGKSSVMQPEDEAEIEQIRRKVVPGDVVGDRIRAAVDRVIQRTGAKFKSEDASRRFRTAVESRMRDIRDHQETLDLLTRPSAAGGFGIPKEQVEKVLRVVEEEVRTLHAKAVPRGGDQLPPLRVRGGEGELPSDRNPSPPPLTLRGGASPPQVSGLKSQVSGRPKMQDIRPVAPRLVGPIEELQQLTLQDFRKIAKAPAEAAQRIVEKLALLEKDSFTKRAEGVKALRGSPLMVVYAEVLGAALMAKRKAEEEVKERLVKDKSALTWEELQALRDLNAQLRF